MKKNKSQIALLRDKRIDLAFVPVDPRLEEQYAWGINYFMQEVDARWVVPMHFGDDSHIVDRLLSDPASEGYRSKVTRITGRGDFAEI